MPPLRPLAVSLALLLVVSNVAAASSPVVTVNNVGGNVIAVGSVVRSDPANALLHVTNGYHFWAAIDLQPATGGATLTPANVLNEDIGGIFAAGGLIGPNSTAAYHAVFDATRGGSQGVRVHFDLSSAGGAAAVAANLLTVIADTMGASLAATSPTALTVAVKAITNLPKFAELIQQIRDQSIWGIVTWIQLLLQSAAGRQVLITALADLHVVATDADLIAAGSVLGIIDWARTLIDLLTAAIGSHADGTVVFSLATSTPTPTPSPVVTAPSHPPIGHQVDCESTAADSIVLPVLSYEGIRVVDAHNPLGISPTSTSAIALTIKPGTTIVAPISGDMALGAGQSLNGKEYQTYSFVGSEVDVILVYPMNPDHAMHGQYSLNERPFFSQNKDLKGNDPYIGYKAIPQGRSWAYFVQGVVDAGAPDIQLVMVASAKSAPIDLSLDSPFWAGGAPGICSH